jgi:hypothetical protein
MWIFLSLSLSLSIYIYMIEGLCRHLLEFEFERQRLHHWVQIKVGDEKALSELSAKSPYVERNQYYNIN